MSKGGQAKVYFVLYLAVVLELLIIIVERDEAEEHLHRQNNETMKIVESILSQLYSGSGTESINTKPQDEITLPAEADMAAIKEIFGAELKTSRKYSIEVGVTDVTLAVKKKEGETSKEYEERIEKLLSLANVEELEYQIFYSPSTSADSLPAFQTDKYIKDNNIDFMKFEGGQGFPGPNGEPWQFVGAYKLSFDKEAAYRTLDINSLQTTLDFIPIYKPLQKVGNGAAARGFEDSAFYYSDALTREAAKQTSGPQKRTFVVNFEPPDRNKAGVYKLRFASQTNRILGVASVDGGGKIMDDAAMVNIGTVQLSVKDLKKVAKELKRRHQELDKVEDIDELTMKSQETAGMEAIRAFDNNINEAISAAASGNNAADIIGKIRLYNYIAKLVTPGQSVNFDQNRGNFDINIRVQTAKPSTAKPYISTLTDDRCFTNSKHVFEVEVGPFKGTGVNKVTGKVLGSVNADVSFEPEVGSTPERDKKYKLRGTINRELPAGKYTLQYTHEISGKSETVFDTLYVYEAGIQDEKRTSDRLDRRANYGNPLAIDMLPNSGNDISASQFKTYVSFDGGARKSVDGYKLVRSDNMDCLANYNKASVSLVWVQPYTYKEFQLYSKEVEIKLEEPSPWADVTPKYTGTGNKVKIELSGLIILSPATGLEDKNAKAILSEPSLKDAAAEVNGYSVTRQPTIVGGDADNGYIIELELSKNSGASVKSAEGVISIPFSVTAKHPTNGKTSRADSEVRFQVDYSPSSGPRRGAPQNPGGQRPPVPPKPQPKR